jgi:hypothetical protein
MLEDTNKHLEQTLIEERKYAKLENEMREKSLEKVRRIFNMKFVMNKLLLLRSCKKPNRNWMKLLRKWPE